LKNSTKNTRKNDLKQTRNVIARQTLPRRALGAPPLPTKGTNLYQTNDDIANDYDHLTPPNYPIAYKARKWFFCGLQLFIDESVLVPRFETEELVNVIASIAKQSHYAGVRRTTDPHILDLCTGSGCIAVALAVSLRAKAKQSRPQITASDISADALKVARKNARAHKVKIKFIQSDLFNNSSFCNLQSAFDVIVCNPPYIKTAEIGKFDKSILHEPALALDGGADGLEFYRRIIADAPKYIAPGGLLFFEVGDKAQALDVKTLLQTAGFCDITITGNHIVHCKTAL